MKTFLTLLSQRTSLLAMGGLLLFQIVFGIVWLTSYNEVHERITDLPVGFIIESTEMNVLVDIEEFLDFETAQFDDIDSGIDALQDKEIFLLIHVTKDFEKQMMESNEPPIIDYYTNEANPLLVSTITNNIEEGITSSLNDIIINNQAEVLFEELNIPTENRQEIVGALTQRIVANENRLNPVDTFSEEMIPLMMVLASFVGTMVMAMYMHQSVSTLKSKNYCTWKLHIFWLVINILAAVFIGLVSGLIVLISQLSITDFHFTYFWMFQTIAILTFMFLTKFIVVLYGQIGMAINIFLLSSQLVTSGVLVPQRLLTDFYHNLSEVLPATYVSEGIYRILFTDLNVINQVQALSIIGIVSMLSIVIVIALKIQFEKMKKRSESNKTHAP